MSSTKESASFKYESLTKPDSFRLILLQPASSHDADLQCSLLHTTISLCDRDIIDHYAALSYVWGDATQTGCIRVDGHNIPITVTLEAALRDLRDRSRVLRIWADALCIDQSNLVERSSQVGLMAQIYSIAHHTVIYLGPLTKNYASILQAAPSNTTGILSNEVSVPDLRTLAVDGLLKLPWFSRVWIFQELVLSRDPWIQCGSVRARWTDICNMLVSPGAGNQSDVKELRVLRDMNYARGVTKQRMIVHLRARRGLGATDPRDFIFAHMFLASDTNTLIRYVQVDYTKTSAEVFEAAARFTLEECGVEGPVRFFQDCTSVRTSKIEGLASWAPDWSLLASGLEPMYCDVLTRRFHQNPKLDYVFVGQPLVLAYVGYQVDTISDDISFVLPDPMELDLAARERYQKAADELEVLYGAGAWWSGDVNGRHLHVDIRGKEAQHEEICQRLADEWVQIMSTTSLHAWKDVTGDEAESHQRFLPRFKSWIDRRAKWGRITVGSNSDGIESIMWLYMRLADFRAVLTARRFAMTKSGNLAVVPKEARKGDLIVFLTGTLVGKVLRPDAESLSEDLKPDIKTAFEAKIAKNGLKLSGYMDTLPMQKCTLVGECHVDGEIGWKYGDDRSNHCTVYALR